MEEIKEKILRVATNLEKDIGDLMKSEPGQHIGAEIMALNALCTAAKTLKEFG